jgi:hypothetical protein
MGRKLLDVEYCKTVGLQDRGCGVEGEVGKVLVVDRVELNLLKKTEQVRNLDGDTPPAVNSFASSLPKKRTSVSTPAARATAATFAAGSIPRAGTPASPKWRSR